MIESLFKRYRYKAALVAFVAGTIIAAPAATARSSQIPATPPAVPTAPGTTGPAGPAPNAPPLPAAAPATQPPAANPLSISARPPESVATAPQLIAAGMARLAMVDLRINQAPQRRDFQIALTLLQAALRLTPGDPDLIRLALDAAVAAEDNAAAEALTREIVKLDPSDTVAQLSLINRRVKKAQSVEERSLIYEQFLGERGKSLDPSIRSRLALDAAMLRREQGDDAGFARLLRIATSLDSTNTDAAGLTVSYFADALPDNSARLELLTNLLISNPLDGRTHLSIARLLASVGASAGSDRFYSNHAQLEARSGASADPTLQAETLVQKWLNTGPEKVYTDLNETVMGPRRRIAAERARRVENKIPVDDLPEEKSLRLSLDLDAVQLMAAASLDRTDATASAASEMRGTVTMFKEWIADDKKRPPGVDVDRLISDVAIWEPASVWMCLWAGAQLADVGPEIDTYYPADTTDANLRARLQGWLKLQTGDAAAAKTLLEPLAATDPLAVFGLALIAERAGDKAGAEKLYNTALAANPGQLASAWGRTRLTRLTGKPVPLQPEAQKLERLAAGIPKYFDEVCIDPRRRTTISAETPQTQLGPVDRQYVTLRVRNVSPIPLGIGPTQSIGTQIVLAPDVLAGIFNKAEYAVPTIVAADRRLRLAPGEEIVMNVWADNGYSSWALSGVTADAQRVRWRVLHGFVGNESGGASGNGFTQHSEVPMITRRSSPTLSLDAGRLSQELSIAEGTKLAEALAVARPKLISASAGDPDARLITDALADRYRKGDVQTKLLILLGTPSAGLAPNAARLDEAILATTETDANVMLVRMVTRVVEGGIPAITSLIASTDPVISTAAKLHKQRLDENEFVFANAKSLKRATLDDIRK